MSISASGNDCDGSASSASSRWREQNPCVVAALSNGSHSPRKPGLPSRSQDGQTTFILMKRPCHDCATDDSGYEWRGGRAINPQTAPGPRRPTPPHALAPSRKGQGRTAPAPRSPPPPLCLTP